MQFYSPTPISNILSCMHAWCTCTTKLIVRPRGVKVLLPTAQWQNGWDSPLLVSCGHKQAFQRVVSRHDNGREDRVWYWTCRTVAKRDWSHCFWTGFQNRMDQPFVFECPNNCVLTGVYSEHNNYHEDRRWKFRCCEAPKHIKKNCDWSGYINDWDAYMDYNLMGTKRVFVGVFSYHSNRRE